jgi:hypothetical protein
MPDDPGTIRRIVWTELFPWLILVRALRLAISARLLVLAAIAVALSVGGWWVFGQLFAGSGDEQLRGWIAEYGELPHPLAIDATMNGFGSLVWPAKDAELPPTSASAPANAIVDPWLTLTRPFRQIFSRKLPVTALAFVLLCALWTDVVWAYFGGVIARLVALQVAREERGSLRGAMRYVRGRYRAYFGAPLYPLFGVLLFVLPLGVIGLLGQLGGVGLFTLGILWPLFLVAGLVITIFLVGLLFGWPLMWPTISAEGTDSFDALSRSYSYVYQRPLYYFVLAVFSGILGSLGWIVVRFFAGLVLFVTAWAVSWGAGGILLDDPRLVEEAPRAAAILGFWSEVVELVATSFVYTFFFSASTIAYLLLRQEVDGTEIDEVFLDEQPEKFGLPPLTPDAAGVPTVTNGSDADEVPAHNGGAAE